MTNFVLDSSVTLAWAFGDQGDHYTEGVLAALLEGEALVPALWVLEVANGLFVAERRQRLSTADADSFAKNLMALPIRLDESDSPQGVGHILTLGRTHGPTVYGAAYVDLALRLGLPLATKDETLRSAARKSGVQLYTRSVTAPNKGP
jgi:predicted nucleic acid-binding protein